MIVGYQALCRELTGRGSFGELSVTGARSVLQRYSEAWFETVKRRGAGETARFPRRKHSLVSVRHYHRTFLVDGLRVRLPVAKGRPELWVRLARSLPYPAEQVERSRCWPTAGDFGWRWPLLYLSSSSPTLTRPVSLGWTLASSTDTRW